MWAESPQLEPGFEVVWSGVFVPPLPTQVLLLLVFRLGSLKHPEPERSLSLSQPTDPAPFWGSPQWLLVPGLPTSPALPQPSLPVPLPEPQPCCVLGVFVHVLDLSSLLLLQVLLVLLLPLKPEPSSQPLCPFSGALLSHLEPARSPQPEPAVLGPDAFISPVHPPDSWEEAAGVVEPQPESPLLCFLSSTLGLCCWLFAVETSQALF